jgi:hypothetical protein
MSKVAKYGVPVLLVLSAILLGVLVPGGPIETRDFSHIDPLVLGAFNTFLTVLGIASLLVAYFAYKERRMAFIVSALCGLGYLLVYVPDLFEIFPVSPDPMPPALWAIEVAGMVLSLPLTALAAWAAFGATDESEERGGHAFKRVAVWLGVPVALLALAIIVFATHAAMQGG